MSIHEDKIRFNPELAMAATGADVEIIREVVEVFLEDVPIQLQRLVDALHNRSQDDLVRTAHTIKGAASNIGAERLGALAFECEQAARAADFDLAEQHAEVVRQECEGLQAEIGAYDWTFIEA